MAGKTQSVPKGYHTVTPSLMIQDAARAIEFYKKAFGAQELSRFAGPDGKLMHAEIKVGDSIIMLGDEMPDHAGPRKLGGTPVAFFIYTDNVDAAWKQAIDAGGKQIAPLENQFWGDRCGCLEDPGGHRWWLAQHVKDVSQEELRKAVQSYAQPAGR